MDVPAGVTTPLTVANSLTASHSHRRSFSARLDAAPYAKLLFSWSASAVPSSATACSSVSTEWGPPWALTRNGRCSLAMTSARLCELCFLRLRFSMCASSPPSSEIFAEALCELGQGIYPVCAGAYPVCAARDRSGGASGGRRHASGRLGRASAGRKHASGGLGRASGGRRHARGRPGGGGGGGKR